MIKPAMRRLLRQVAAGTVYRTVRMKHTRSGSRYEFGWSTTVGLRTGEIADRAGYTTFIPPTEKLDNPFVAAGGVGGKLELTDKGREALLPAVEVSVG